MREVAADAKERFTNRVADYVVGRPTYPLSILETLSQRIGFGRDWRVADIGAGTGISTKLFADNGNPVTAVEPNQAMREAAMEYLNGTSVRFLPGAAADTGLDAGSVDLVVAAQAFHWFELAPFVAECRRILTPRGRVMLMWNERDLADPVVVEYKAIVARYSMDYEKVAHRKVDNEPRTIGWFDPKDFFKVELPNPQQCTREALQARIASASYLPNRGHPNYDAMVREVNELFDRHAQNGVLQMPYHTLLYVGLPR